jgi:hypothetical protein
VVPEWHRFEVDGVAYYWRSYATVDRQGRPADFVIVEIAARPGERGAFGLVCPAGTVAAERHAIEALRIYLANGGTFA